jgi:hypothetical protein
MTAKLDDAALEKFLDLTFDHLCKHKLSELIDPDRVVAAIDETHTPARIADFQFRVVSSLRTRLIDRAKKSEVLLSAWLPEDARDRIAEMLGQPAPIPQKLIDEAVSSEGVRDQIREALRDTISNFIKGAGGGGQGAGAIRGAIGFGARAFGAAGKAVLGGLGDELQKQMQERVKDFVDGAVEGVQDRIAKRLADPKTAEELGKRRRKAFLKMLDSKESDAAKMIARAPHAQIDSLVPEIVRHNVVRKEVRDTIRDEVAAVVADLSKENIGDLLDRFGARTLARQALHSHALPIARDLVKTPEFAAWWAATH